MSTKTKGWLHCLDAMSHQPIDTFEHRFADTLKDADDEQAWEALTDACAEDPPGHVIEVAARLLSHLMEPEVTL